MNQNPYTRSFSLSVMKQKLYIVSGGQGRENDTVVKVRKEGITLELQVDRRLAITGNQTTKHVRMVMSQLSAR